MSPFQPSFKIIQTFFLTVLIVIISLSSSHAQTPELLVRIDDTVSYSNDGDERMLLINMSNYADTVAGFNMWLKIGSPNIIKFMTNDSTVIDTNYWQCINWEGSDCVEYIKVFPFLPYDSISIDTNNVEMGIVDTINTLISGWQAVDSRSIDGLAYDILIVGYTNINSPPYMPGIPPQNNHIPFIKVPYEVLEYPPHGDTFNVEVIIVEYPDFFDPNSDTIGIAYDTTIDTSYFICNHWYEDTICLNWQQTTGPPFDSIFIDSNHLVPYIDTNLLILINATITILPECIPINPGDVDGDGIFEISDLVMLTNFVYYGTPPLIAPWNGDVDGNCILNWDDVIKLEETGAPFAECTCPDPQWVCCRGLTGNVNYDRYDNVLVDDLSFLVDYLFKGGPTPPCIEETLINPYIDNTTPLVSDLTHLVNYLFKSGELPDNCPE